MAQATLLPGPQALPWAALLRLTPALKAELLAAADSGEAASVTFSAGTTGTVRF